MNIDHKSSTPLHMQAEMILRNLIESEEYKNGKLLPSEVELSKQFGIARNTLRQAINTLVYEGILVRKKGVGTKVVRRGIRGGVKNWMSFSQEMKTLGVEVKNFELHIAEKKVSNDIAKFFGINHMDRCLCLERVRGNKEYPFVYFISYFNPSIGVTPEDDFMMPLYEMLESKYGIQVMNSSEEISAGLAGDFIASKLEISADDPILIRKRLVSDVNGKPVEYNVGYYRADSFTYTIEASR